MAELTVKNIAPLAGFVVVEPAEAQRQTSSGIYLPSGGEEKPQVGKVVAVGGDTVNEHGVVVKAPVKKDDTVLYKKWGGNEIKLADGKEVQVMKFEDLIAVIKE